MIHPPLSEQAESILARLTENGFKPYIVGGAVRDALLDRSSGDVDILSLADLKQIRDLFADRKVKIAGRTFPVCLVNGIEVAAPRQPKDLTNFPESDLGHRDLTINAMALDPETGKFIDPFNGRQDLENRVIRFTRNPEDRIEEDPVRMIRACRFAALLDAGFDPASQAAVALAAERIATQAAPERVRLEIFKAMTMKQPSLFFKTLQRTGLLKFIFPSLDRCLDLDGGPHHGETVFEHCLLVGDALPADRPLLRLAGYLHDTGKFDAARITDGKLTFVGHENETSALEKDLEKLKFSNTDTAFLIAVFKSHMRPLDELTTPRAARRLLVMLKEYGLDFRDFLRMRLADRKGNLKKDPYTFGEIKIKLKKLLDEIHASPLFGVNQLKITGTEIAGIFGVSPGPQIGKIKQMLFEQVLDDPTLNTNEKLKNICLSLKIKK